ncbi:MAG: SoxR reducing system RseC family protein [Porticoccaceae bacterium]|nr:SoxR reducing system RseC family protein [Porticoccaceae bacterium]
MILETGTVVAVEADSLWVETIQRSTCEACAAEKGCGQRVLSKLTGKTNRIRVLFDSQSSKKVSPGQSVTIGIPEDVIVSGSILVYLLPVVSAVIGAWITGSQSDVLGILGAGCGLLLGGLIVSLHSKRGRNDLRYNPVLLEGPSENQVLDFL